MSKHPKALILLVHGSRDESWLLPFRELIRELSAADPEAKFSLACLQFGRPNLREAARELCDGGYREALVVPFFISALGHVQKDVPKLVQSARESCPEMKIMLVPALGEQPEVKAAFQAALLRLARSS
jgi:sirohydrochlorin cobaltochelatase